MLSTSKSGDYGLPSPALITFLNLMLRADAVVPRGVAGWYLHRHRYYQVVDDEGATEAETQGVSQRKWEAMEIEGGVKGRSLLDIGCAEGFFCLQAARHGARRVVGVDSRFTTILSARFLAKRERLNVDFRIGVFPDLGNERFDYVLCLSVLHHLTSTKDIWKVLTQERYAQDLNALRSSLAALRRMTAEGGRCIIEMPYEYEDDASRQSVDFNRFLREITDAKFRAARVLGTWEHNPQNRARKDRILYLAEA